MKSILKLPIFFVFFVVLIAALGFVPLGMQQAQNDQQNDMIMATAPTGMPALMDVYTRPTMATAPEVLKPADLVGLDRIQPTMATNTLTMTAPVPAGHRTGRTHLRI